MSSDPASISETFGVGAVSVPRFANCAAVNSVIAPAPNVRSTQLVTQRFCEPSKTAAAGKSRSALWFVNWGSGLPLAARRGGSNSFTDGPKRFGTHKPPLLAGVGVLVGVLVALAVGVVVVVPVAVA